MVENTCGGLCVYLQFLQSLECSLSDKVCLIFKLYIELSVEYNRVNLEIYILVSIDLFIIFIIYLEPTLNLTQGMIYDAEVKYSN